MIESDPTPPSPPTTIQGHLDTPRLDTTIYDETIFLSGWVYAAQHKSPFRSVRAYFNEVLFGETHIPFARPDVCAQLCISSSELTGFRILGRIPGGGVVRTVGLLRVIASWDEHSAYTLTERPVQIISARLSERAHGTVLDPANPKLLYREDIYGSGPPIENPSDELSLLLQNYLPKNSSVLDIGCGAGAYGPGLIATGHTWLGLEQNAHCCELLEQRRLPFRRVETTSRRLPCQDEEWDCAICIEVLEHIDDTDSFVKEVARVTRARALFSVPNLEVLPYMHAWGVVPWHMLEADHRNFFTRASLSQVLKRFFRKVEVFPYGMHPLRSREDIPLYQHLFAVADK